MILSVAPGLAGGPVCPSGAVVPRVLIAGDSWAQYMWDDGSHNALFDRFGHGDKGAISRSLSEDPGPGYTGPEYAISGSEARQWVDTSSYPWIANVVADLVAFPTVDTVMLSIDGNDVLAGKSGGGWYKDMDLDASGSEAALFDRIQADTETIVSAIEDVSPGIQVLLSSYEYPNFNVSFLWCWIYACPKREDLSRDPVNNLITDVELNGMMVTVEGQRIGWTNADPRWAFDNGVGLMHHYYGDGVSPPGVLPHPGQTPPDYDPFPGGNPELPTLRENFRPQFGLDADPIHLDEEGYRVKITNQIEAYFLPQFRGTPTATLTSQGGPNDGWTDGVIVGTGGIRMGDDGADLVHGIVSFDTSPLPGGFLVTEASLYLLREAGSGVNPFVSGLLGQPRVDIVSGSFGAPPVEPADATAPADAADVGCLHGSAKAGYDAVRIDLTQEALDVINGSRLVQLRLAFSTQDAGEDDVTFWDGDAVLPARAVVEEVVVREEVQDDGRIELVQRTRQVLEHRGLAEVLGSPAPILDLTYVLTPNVFSDGFETGDTSLWSASVP